MDINWKVLMMVKLDDFRRTVADQEASIFRSLTEQGTLMLGAFQQFKSQLAILMQDIRSAGDPFDANKTLMERLMPHPVEAVNGSDNDDANSNAVSSQPSRKRRRDTDDHSEEVDQPLSFRFWKQNKKGNLYDQQILAGNTQQIRLASKERAKSQFQCSACDQQFFSRTKMLAHQRSVHGIYVRLRGSAKKSVPVSEENCEATDVEEKSNVQIDFQGDPAAAENEE